MLDPASSSSSSNESSESSTDSEEEARRERKAEKRAKKAAKRAEKEAKKEKKRKEKEAKKQKKKKRNGSDDEGGEGDLTNDQVGLDERDLDKLKAELNNSASSLNALPMGGGRDRDRTGRDPNYEEEFARKVLSGYSCAQSGGSKDVLLYIFLLIVGF
jgi:hypothetical protein